MAWPAGTLPLACKASKPSKTASGYQSLPSASMSDHQEQYEPRVGDANSSDPMERIRAGGSKGGQARAAQLGHEGYQEMGSKGGQTVREMSQRAKGMDEEADATKAAKDKIMPTDQ
eukprot:jgi/Chlat1/7996/Chrsp7S07778